MADDDQNDSEKTEEPTPKKMRDARERGQVVLSREINNWVMIFASAIVILSIGPSLLSDMRVILEVFIAQPHILLTDPDGLGGVLKSAVIKIGVILLLPVLTFMAAGILGPMIQVGPLFSASSMKPSLEKISIIKGFQRLFSSRAIVEFLKGLTKIVVISAVSIILISPFFQGVEHFVGQDAGFALFELHHMAFRLITGVLAVLTVIAVLDYIYQQREHMKKLRMSKQDVKDEYKQLEGDPHVKQRLRELRLQKAQSRMMAAVPTSDVVITNPTHYALALKYDPVEMQAPVLVAKGVDEVAERIKDMAKEHSIPVIENPQLARALYDIMELDEMIPESHFHAVAEIISYIFKLKNKTVH